MYYLWKKTADQPKADEHNDNDDENDAHTNRKKRKTSPDPLKQCR